jgi:hypothetical protein
LLFPKLEIKPNKGSNFILHSVVSFGQQQNQSIKAPCFSILFSFAVSVLQKKKHAHSLPFIEQAFWKQENHPLYLIGKLRFRIIKIEHGNSICFLPIISRWMLINKGPNSKKKFNLASSLRVFGQWL